MKKLGFTFDDIVDGIDFTEDDYIKAAKKDDATFKESIHNIMNICKECNGTLEDAIFIAEDALVTRY